jgi:hypothetical protein
MFSETDYAGAAARLVAPIAHIKAFSDVESSGETEWMIAGESVPPLRFEAHWFGKLTGYKYNTSHPDLSSINWNPSLAATTRAGALAQVSAAEALDKDAADQATSWGAFQVMGFNYTRLGFANVAAFVADMMSAGGQMDAFERFVRTDRDLLEAVREGDWPTCETLYNGGGFNGVYAARLEAAAAHYGAHPHAAPRLLMQGAVGPDVARLWQALGLPPQLEFTPELADDVVGFQSGHGLVADGIVGPMTRRALGL